ncbi:MAG: hypothetical protein KDD89_15060, partial [Anaerolineales bacterium]|nr:hypothetical protein [Anaerolineales bacterium]
LLYSAVVLSPNFDGGSTIPSAASRIPNGQDTDSAADWTRNDLANPTQAVDTPNAENAMYSPPVSLTPPLLNEFMLDYTGAGNIEFVEISGETSANYSRYSLIAINGDITETVGITPTQGIIDVVLPMGSTDANGYFATTYSGDIFTRDTTTLLLVDGFTGAEGDDLDTNNDGTLDVTPWSALVDDVAVTNGEASALTYSAVVLNPTYDGGTTPPGGASRLPDSTDTDAVGDWTRNDDDGVYDVGEAANTAGAVNALATPPPTPDAMINEFTLNHNGTEAYEYVEIFGDPATDYSAYTILEIELDYFVSIPGIANPGVIENIIPVGSTDANGFWDTGFLPAGSLGDVENASVAPGGVALILVEGFSGALTQDLDTNNDGVFDVTPWTRIVDDVASGSQLYGPTSRYSTSFIPNEPINPTVIFSASRIPNGQDTNSTADWTRNDFDGAGIPALDPGSPG